MTTPPTNVIRFILYVPKHGGNNNGVLLRTFTSGTIHQLDVVYTKGGKLTLNGYDSLGALLFSSNQQGWSVDATTLMVSVELTTNGTAVNWAIRAVEPGKDSLVGTKSGTLASATVGNVSEVIAGPNQDITKTAMGHISVQYALVPLIRVSKALDGHHSEMGIDRFIRFCNEQVMDHEIILREKAEHWGFEDGTTQGCGSQNATINNELAVFNAPTYYGDAMATTPYDAGQWPTDGIASLHVACTGTGLPRVFSDNSLSGLQPINPGDVISVDADVYTIDDLSGNLHIGVRWFDASGNGLVIDWGDPYTADAGQIQRIRFLDVCPTLSSGVTPQYFNWQIQSDATEVAGTDFYIDNVRTHPRMGPQTRKEQHHILQEIKHLDQGLLHDARKLHGLHYRSRISMFFQTAAVTLDYSLSQPSPDLQPVVDDMGKHNHVTVKRHKGTKVEVASLTVPVPKKKKAWRVAAHEDRQLLALAQHLLNLGLDNNERYPTVTVNLVRPELSGLYFALANVEMGDFIKIINLPFWYPATTAKQLVMVYTEDITPCDWQIQWNCIN